MDAPTDLIQPRAGVTPPTAPPAPEAAAPPAPEEGASSAVKLPDDIIRIPAMQALVAGNPPAMSARLKEFESNPVAKLIVANKDGLVKSGMGFYRSVSGEFGVIFNQFHIHGDEIQQADKAGQLQMIAPPFDVVNEAVGKSGMTNPVMNAGELPGGFKPAPMPTPPQSSNTPPMVPPASPGVSRKMTSARIKNMAPSAPTSGSKPGSGRLLNDILKPVV